TAYTKGKRPKTASMAGKTGLAPASSGKSVKDRYSCQNYQGTDDGISKVLAECVVKQDGRRQYEQTGNYRVSPNLVWPGKIRFALSENEHRAGRDHVKEPFRKDRQREKLAEISSHQKQNHREYSLRNDGGGRGAKLGVHSSQGVKRISVPGHREGHACSAHAGSVQRHKHGQSHSRGNDARANSAQNDCRSFGRGTLRDGDRRGRQHVLHGGIDQNVQSAHNRNSGN